MISRPCPAESGLLVRADHFSKNGCHLNCSTIYNSLWLFHFADLLITELFAQMFVDELVRQCCCVASRPERKQ